VGEVFEQRELLPREERSRFDDQILAASECLKSAGTRHQQFASLPIRQPDPIAKTWRKKEAHGEANARALAAAEVAQRDLKTRERQDKEQRPATPERVPEEADEEIRVPATLEQSLPSSTAPARLASEGEGEGEGRDKRKRKMTEAYREARQGFSHWGTRRRKNNYNTVGVASQMLHEQDAIVEDTVYGRSYWLARIASAVQYKLSMLEWQHHLS